MQQPANFSREQTPHWGHFPCANNLNQNFFGQSADLSCVFHNQKSVDYVSHRYKHFLNVSSTTISRLGTPNLAHWSHWILFRGTSGSVVVPTARRGDIRSDQHGQEIDAYVSDALLNMSQR
jgi:hypothetical protein